MVPASNASKRRFRVGSATLLVCLSLPVADRLSGAVGPETAALGVFVLLFIGWCALGLLMDGLWRKSVGVTADPANDPGGYFSRP